MPPPPVLHREVRVPPTPSSATSVLHIDAAGGSQQRGLTRAGSKRPFDEIGGLDEEAYARKCLATEGSVYFRTKQRSPRSLLWRVLDDRKVLELQAVDIVNGGRRGEGNSWLSYRVTFKEKILPCGVAFADPEAVDALECFVLTESKDLCTITLKRDLLTRANVPPGFDAASCVKKCSSSFLSLRQPYRFVVVSSLELLVSLADGGLVRLERKANESGAQWRETFFSEGGWSGTLTLKRINPFSHNQTVRYGNIDLDPAAIVDMSKSPCGRFVWTVGLDSWVRAWSIQTGKVILKMDLLGENREHEKRLPYVMSAEQGKLLQILRLPHSSDGTDLVNGTRADSYDEPYYLALHSPRDHQFKIYKVVPPFSSIDGPGIAVEDVRPNSQLIPPVDELMDTNIWHLESFHVQPRFDSNNAELWIRARSGTLCKTFTTTFDIVPPQYGENDHISEMWRAAWSVVDQSSLSSEELRLSAGFPGDLDVMGDDAVTPSEKWLKFLLHPARFSETSLESALCIYRKGRGMSLTPARGTKAGQQPLEERLTTAITSKIMLRRLTDEQPDYVRFQQEIQAQWQTFYSLLSHLHNLRHESIGLAFDDEDGLPWSVCADFVAPIRACSKLERRMLNTRLLDNKTDKEASRLLYTNTVDKDDDKPKESASLSYLLVAAGELRRSLPDTVQEKLRLAASADALVRGNDNAEGGRANAMFERCGLDLEITDDDFEALSAGVEILGGLGSLQDDTFLRVLEWIDEEGGFAGHDSGAQLTSFGPKVLMVGVEETARRAQCVLLDVLTLVVFMAGGLEEEELDQDFDADSMYDATVERLRRTDLFLWLIGHSRERTIKVGDAEISSEVTLFEDVFIGDWRSLDSSRQNGAMPDLLTIWTKAWIHGIRTSDTNWEGITTHILAFLITRKEVDLAVDFLPFTTGKSAWSTYVKARLFVLLADYSQASLAFRSAATECARGKDVGATKDTAALLSPEERMYFGSGYAAYFQHVAAIFEKLRAYSYVADSSYLALQHTERIEDFSGAMARLDRKKQHRDSPAPERISVAQEESRLLKIKEARDEILNRLFNALVQTGRYAEAYEALAEIEDQPMKRSDLKRLLDSCVKQDAVPSLLELPFAGDLALEADKVLLAMAKKDLAAGTTSIATPTYQILFAFRTQRQDFRGAAEILYEHLERLRHTPYHHVVQDPEDETLVQVYVLLINTLACCGDEDAWLLADSIPGVHKQGRKRTLVTLADLRREYTAELDKRSDMLYGRFALVGGDEDAMDVL
ncbi:hypothetical protein B0A50_03036 [Salinomyces thailandicus]|uniref:Nuclear pore complex protein Nup160 n=1 Tax=Salinomyces thailandicus TaxID=706561 RepID=A0A4U0U1I8_9PEZI|nr:hypothetical protein B0A50_03036 [Salinomyces thailandica]